MRVLRDQYLQEWERGRGDEGERKRERKCVQTAYLAKAVEGHRLPPHFPLEPPEKQCGIETYQQQQPTTRTKHVNYTANLPTTTVTPAVIKRRRKLTGCAHVFLLLNWQCSEINNAGLNNLHQLKRSITVKNNRLFASCFKWCEREFTSRLYHLD